jgi:hypothetical protein
MKKKITIATLVILGLFVSVNVIAQEQQLTKEEKKELKKQKKALRKAEREAYDKSMHELASKALKESNFVLEASTLYNKRGYSKQVSDHLNFISVSGDTAVLQLAFTGHGGYNGVGGITLNGRISDKEYSEDKHGNQYLTFNVMGSFILADVRISLSGGGNYADAQVDATTKSGKIKFRGQILPAELSTVYKSGIEY